MRTSQYPPYTINDPVETPGGILVSARSAQELIKSEAKKMRQEENKTSFFSRFALAQNMVAYGAREKPQGTPHFELLYEASRKSFVDRIIIQARIDQTKRIWQRALSDSKQIGFKVVHDRHGDKDFAGNKDIDSRCREMEEFLQNPTPTEYIWLYPHNIRPHTGIKDMMSRLTRAELIIDRKVIRRYKRRDGKGYGAFHWVPGGTIKNVDETVRAWAKKNETSGKVGRDTIERMSYATGFDLARAQYVQVIDGMITEAYAEDEIAVHTANPSDELNRWGYGESRLEMSLDVTTTLLYAWNYNKEMFKTNYPEQLLTVAGDFDKEGLAAFRQQILGDAGGVGNNWRLPVIPAGDVENFQINSVKLRESPKDMLFDQLIRLLLMFKCAAYGAHPSTLNLQTDSGGGSSLFSHNPTDEIEFSKEHGLIPAITDMCEWLTDSIVKPRYDDLKVVIVGLDPEDEKQAVDLRTQRASKWVTRNEARQEEGRKPFGDEKDPENPWNYPADVPITNYINTFNMIDQQQQQQDQGGDWNDQPDGQDEDVQKSMGHHHIKRQPIETQTKYLKITIGE